jgi:DNA repair exonuclease SbcCD nuclease subunit
MKLFHAADIHLGRRRLEGRLPDKDLADAFGFVADQAISEKADVLLIAGDLFDRAQVEPPHLRQAQQVLARLKAAGIPVVAIEGNHDKAFIHSENPTWLNYLAEDDLLILLRTQFNASGPLLVPWDNQRKTGSWLDIGGVRFVGAGYLGAATPHKVREMVAQLDLERPHVLLLHAGPEYFVGEGGGFSPADLEAIRQRVCYLALGHIHKPIVYEDWACNPGSLENCDLREATLPGPRGYAVVEIDSNRHRPLSIQVRDNPRRPCLSLVLDCTSFGNKLKKGAQALVDEAVDLIRSHIPPAEAVVGLALTGKLNLDRIALDQRSACAEIEKAAHVHAVAFDTTGLNIDGVLAPELGPGTNELTREALEKSAIRSLVDEDNLWGLEGKQQDFAGLFYDLKEAVRLGSSGDDLADRISQSTLVDLVQKALEEQAQRETRDERDKWKETGESAAKGFETMVKVAEAQGEVLNT